MRTLRVITNRAVIDIDMQLCQHVIDMRKSCRCRHKKYFNAYTDMLFQSNGTQKYLRNNKIMSNFSRDTTIVAFCRPSFIPWSQCALYFWVCSISRLFLCAMNIKESVISSPHLEVGMISLLYNSTTEQLWYLYKISSRVFSWGPPSSENFVNPLSNTCPHFWTKACSPQPRFIPENLKRLNTFLCQI